MAVVTRNQLEDNLRKRAEEMGKTYVSAQEYSRTHGQNAQTISAPEVETTRSILGKISSLTKRDQAKGKAAFQQFQAFQADAASPIYNPYALPTNRSVSNLASMGVDTSKMDDDWYNQMGQLRQYYQFNGTTNTPSKPGKKASGAEVAAYEFYQIEKSRTDTENAKRELAALRDEVAYWAGRTDLNLSDEQIIKKIGLAENSKYKTLAKMDATRLAGTPMELNEAIDYIGEDSLYGMIWAARNDGGTGNSYADMANSYNQVGNVWKYNRKIAERLDPESDNFAPYMAGTTNMDDAAVYFGVNSFGPNWLADNDGMQWSSDETKVKMYRKVAQAEENWQKANSELEELNKWLTKKLGNAKDPKKVMEKIDWDDYPTLSAMNKSTGYTDINGVKTVGTGNLLAMTRGIDYSYKSILDRVVSACERNSAKVDGDDTVDGFTPPSETATTTVPSTDTATAPATQTEETPEQPKSFWQSAGDVLHMMGQGIGNFFGWIPAEGTEEEPTAEPEPSHPEDALPPAPSPEETSGAVDARTAPKVATAGPTPTPPPVTTPGPMTTPAPRETTGTQHTEAVLNEKVEDGASVLDTSMTLAEQRFFQNVPGVEYDRIRDRMIKGPLNPALWQDENFKGYNFRKSEAKRNQEYTDTLIGNAGTIKEHDDLQKNIEEIEGTLNEYEEKYGDQIYAGTEVPEEIEFKLSNGASFAIYLNPDTGLYESPLLNGGGLETLETYAFRMGFEATDDIAEEIQTHIDRANSFAQTVSNANEKYGAERQEGVPTLDEVNALYDRLDNYRSQLDEGMEAYNEAVESNVRAKNRKNIMDEMLLKNGFDVQDAANFEVIADSIVNIGSWQEPDPLPLSLSTQLMESYAIGKTDIANADEQIKEIDENIADAKYLLQFVGSSQEYTDGINGYINYMEGQKRQFEYFKLSTDEHFGDWVKVGQNQIMSGSANVGPLYNTMSYDEQEMFMALLGRYGQDAADKYFQDIEQTLVARTQYVIDTNATEIAESGAAGRVLNLVEGIGIAPLDVLSSALDIAHTVVTGEGNDWLQVPRHISQSAYAADQRAIEEKYKDNPALKTVVSGIYEIVYNRGRSAMVGGTFGKLFPTGTSEVFQAMPIALTAADETLQKYLDAGVEPWKAGALATVAFLSESLTEGIELKNIKNAFSLGEDVSRSALATFFGNYIPNALPEIVGESVNDIAEKMADYWLAGDRGDLRGLMQSYLDHGLAANEDEAYEMMMRDQISDVAHTALISLFSPLADLGSVAAGSISSYSYYAQKARNISNLTGQKVTARELRNGDIATIKAANRAAEESDLREPGAFNLGDQRPAIPRVTLEGQENTNQYELEITILDGVADSDATTQAATVAAVMENAGGDRNRADAVAAHIGDVFDDAINTVQQIMAGGMSADVNINMLKSGFAQAVLGNGKARALVNSEDFRNAAPDTQARWLAQVGAEDAANPDVQNQVANAVHENRVANEEKRLLANGAAKPAQDAAAKALASAKANEQAKDDLESRQNDLEAKGQNLEAAQFEFQQDPGNPAKADQVTHAIGEVTKANEVAQEYEQHSRNAQETADKDKAEAKRVADETMADIRSQAEASVAQQEQAEAEAAAVAQAEAEAEQQRLEEEAREQTIARAGENSANHADREAFVSRWIEDHPNATQEDLQHIREVWDQAHEEAVMASPILQPLMDKEGKFTEKGLKTRDKIVKHIGEKFNVDISYASTDPNAENYDPALIGNGYYNKDTGKIVLNQDVSMSDAVYVFLVHELTHVAEAAGTYTEMADSLLRLAYGKDAQSYQDAIDNLKKNGGKATTQMEADLIEGYYNRYKRNLGNKVDYEYAMQEMVADYMGTLIKPNSEAERTDMIDRLVADNPSVARRIMDTIKNFIKKVAGIEDSWLDDARHTVDLFEKSLSAVRENQETIQSAEEQEAKPITDANGKDTDAVELRGGTVAAVPENVRHSLRTWTEDEKTKVRKALIKTGRFGTSDIDNWINSVNGIAATIAADKTRLDFEVTDSDKSMVKPNADYGASIDASTLCAKRLVYQGTFDAIQHLLPNTALMPDDLIHLANMMREMGYETPCGICYVESRRRNLDKFANEWLQDYKGEYVPSLDEVTTSDGLEKLRTSDAPGANQAYKDFVAAMGALNQRNPKVVQLRTEYKGEIRDMTDRAVQKAINHGGLRLQSFSDFETPHLLDMIQVVYDMAARGLTSQAYTKVPNFAWAFGDTGVKINLSLIGKGEGVDENGNLVFDDVEGMPFEEAMKLRNRYSKNVGTILVGINDAHIKAAMADPRIDFIIPFHRSGWTKQDLRLMPVIEKYTDYTLQQNERDVNTGKKTDKNLEPVGEEGYWDFGKTGKENAERYLELCKENGIIPKFDKFLVNNGDGSYSLQPDGSTDGYWKTLIDFKMYDNDGVGSPQTAVTPDVNMVQAERILDEYKLERNQPGAEPVKMADNNSLPVAQPVVERFVKEYKAKHPLDEGRIKYSLPSDAPYMAAVERGEMDRAQQMVDEKAQEAGYTIRGYHGTAADFNTFDKSKAGKNWQSDSRYGPGFYFAHDDYTALQWTDGTRVIDSYLKMNKPLDLRKETPQDIAKAIEEAADERLGEYTYSKYLTYDQYVSNVERVKQMELNNPEYFLSRLKYDNSGKMTDGIREFLSGLGYDGIITDDEMVVFDPEQIKSAAPVTYDDAGNVIPLSERFNNQNNDIRYSLPSDNVLRDQMNEYLANGGSLAERQTPPEETNLPGAPGMGPQRQFGSRTAQESDALHQEVKDYLYSHSTYTQDSNQAQIDRAISWVQNHANDQDQEGYFGAVADVESPDFDYRSADGQARMLTLMGMAALKGDVATELRLADAYNRQGTDLGQQLQARKLFRMMTPLGRRTILQQQVSRINQQFADQGQSRRVGLPDFILTAAEKAKTADDFDRVRKAAAQTLASQMPMNWKEKLTAWRMLAMLGNPRTHVRNILGNFIFMPAVGLKNKIGAGIETVFLKEGERSKTLGFASSEARAFAKEDAKAVKNILTGEAKYREGDQVQRERKPFKNSILQGISDFNGWALEAEDWVFLERHYRNALAGYMTANKLTEANMTNETLQKARTYAIQEAQKATYRDANAVASWLNEAQRKHPGIGFVVNAVLPFKKTPANILKRGVEYSPVGLINALTRGSKQLLMYQNAVKNGLPIPDKAISPAQYIDKISAGLSGTAITAIGAMLSALGVATAGLNDDDDELKKLQGKQEYSLNLNLFGQDVSYTVDWAAPVCMPFFVGATIMDIYKDQSNGEEFDIGEVLDSILGITEPVFNLSMLDGVNSLLETAQYGEGNAITQIGEKVLTNYVSSFVPTFSGQIARTIDPTRRKSFVESGASLSTFRYALEGLENKIPYLSRTNIPYRDVWGNSEMNGSWAENFFSPGYSNEIKNDPVATELDRIYQETGVKSVIPKAAGKTVSGEKLSAERYDQYSVDRGQMAYQTIQSLMEYPLWQTCDDETRANMIGDAWTYANALAKYNLQGGKVDSWIMNASANGSVVKDIYNRAADKNRANYISGYGQALAEAIDNDDEEAMGVSMQALEDAGATETQIKGAIRDYFKPLYQRAFMNGDEDTMEDIEEKVVDATSDFAKKNRLTSEIISTWVPGADEEEDEEETESAYSWLNLQND